MAVMGENEGFESSRLISAYNNLLTVIDSNLEDIVDTPASLDTYKTQLDAAVASVVAVNPLVDLTAITTALKLRYDEIAVLLLLSMPS